MEMEMYSLNNPLHAGRILNEVYMNPTGETVAGLAEKLDVSASTVSALVSEKSNLTYDMAVRLSKIYKRTPEGWMNIQTAFEKQKAESKP